MGLNGSYFTTTDGSWFQPTDLARGPWDPDACHAGPPTSLMLRAAERLLPDYSPTRITVELHRPIPMAGFRLESEVIRSGRAVASVGIRVMDDERIYASAVTMQLTRLETEVTHPEVAVPLFTESVPGEFPISDTFHSLPGFVDSLEVRYDPAGSMGKGGPTTMWMRTVPILPDEEPSGYQRIGPLADCGNGISFNDHISGVTCINADLNVNLYREPVGDWFAMTAVTHGSDNGVGISDGALFDTNGAVGRSTQSLLLRETDID